MTMRAHSVIATTTCAAAVAMAATVIFSDVASAQGVDRYRFLEVKKQVEKLTKDMDQIRNALAGGNMQQRLNSLEDEISRLTGQIEQLEFAVRKQTSESKLKLEDLEYRIIELEGGDPSILFENNSGQSDQGAVAPSIIEPSQPSGGTLGVLTTTVGVSGSEKASFDEGVAAVQAGRTDQGRSLLEGFISSYPDSALAGDANFWLGESYFRNGNYQAAANRFLDGATLYPGSPKAPDSLLKLGVTLSLLGQTDVACSTLREVGQRYPNAGAVVAKAETEAQRSGCG